MRPQHFNSVKISILSEVKLDDHTIDNKLTIIKKFVGPLTKHDLNNIIEIINNL